VRTGRLVLATRGSQLALAQTEGIAGALRSAWPGLEVELLVVRTRGDAGPALTPDELGAGAFVNEVRAAVADGRAAAAVHSYKDLPTAPVPGIAVAAVPKRGDPRDALVSRRGVVMTYLEPGSRIGTGSRRRAAQLERRRSDLEVVPLRGNVDSRLRRLDDGELDAIVVAAAGLERLGLADRISEAFDVDVMVPAAGQGALAIETRQDDEDACALVASLHDPDTGFATAVERVCLAVLGAGCNAPVGVHAALGPEHMRLEGIVLGERGREAARIQWSGPRAMEAEEAGTVLAELLTETGARNILAESPGWR
jgi:hydroxymethylbilane synthase